MFGDVRNSAGQVVLAGSHDITVPEFRDASAENHVREISQILEVFGEFRPRFQERRFILNAQNFCRAFEIKESPEGSVNTHHSSRLNAMIKH